MVGEQVDTGEEAADAREEAADTGMNAGPRPGDAGQVPPGAGEGPGDAGHEDAGQPPPGAEQAPEVQLTRVGREPPPPPGAGQMQVVLWGEWMRVEGAHLLPQAAAEQAPVGGSPARAPPALALMLPAVV